jgi:hypothetical protein
LVVGLALLATSPATARTVGAATGSWRSQQFGFGVSWRDPWEKFASDAVPGDHDMLRLQTDRIAEEFYGIASAQTDPPAILHAFLKRFRPEARDLTVVQEWSFTGGARPSPMVVDYHEDDGTPFTEVLTAFPIKDGTSVYVWSSIRQGDLLAGYTSEQLRALDQAVSLDLPQPTGGSVAPTATPTVAAAATAPPVPDATADQECADYATKALADWGQYGLTADDVEVFSGCFRDAAGSWFLPTGPDDPRFRAGPILDAAAQTATAALRQMILDQIAGFEALLQAEPWQGESLFAALRDRFYDPQVHGGTGHDRGSPDSITWHAYWDPFAAYLRDPNHVALAAYVGWFGERRAAIQDRVCGHVDPYFCPSVSALVTREPWPWDLRDGVELASFLKWAAGNGLAP